MHKFRTQLKYENLKYKLGTRKDSVLFQIKVHDTKAGILRALDCKVGKSEERKTMFSHDLINQING